MIIEIPATRYTNRLWISFWRWCVVLGAQKPDDFTQMRVVRLGWREGAADRRWFWHYRTMFWDS